MNVVMSEVMNVVMSEVMNVVMSEVMNVVMSEVMNVVMSEVISEVMSDVRSEVVSEAVDVEYFVLPPDLPRLVLFFAICDQLKWPRFLLSLRGPERVTFRKLLVILVPVIASCWPVA
jgi:hypothetical protein